MTASRLEPHTEKDLGILTRHANITVGEFLTRVGLGLRAENREALKARIASVIPEIILREKRQDTEQEAVKAGISDDELALHDAIAVGSLVSALEKISDHLTVSGSNQEL